MPRITKKFTYKGQPYGYIGGELHRLPFTGKNGHQYPLMKLNPIKVGNGQGYRLSRDKKSLRKIQELIKAANHA